MPKWMVTVIGIMKRPSLWSLVLNRGHCYCESYKEEAIVQTLVY